MAVVVMVPVLELITVYCCGLLVKILSLGMQTFFICFSFVCVVNKKSLFLKQERAKSLPWIVGCCSYGPCFWVDYNLLLWSFGNDTVIGYAQIFSCFSFVFVFLHFIELFSSQSCSLFITLQASVLFSWLYGLLCSTTNICLSTSVPTPLTVTPC